MCTKELKGQGMKKDKSARVQGQWIVNGKGLTPKGLTQCQAAHCDNEHERKLKYTTSVITLAPEFLGGERYGIRIRGEQGKQYSFRA